MEPSLFIEYVEKYFPKLVISITNLYNDSEKEPVFYHQRFLRTSFSTTGKWEAITRYNKAVMADIVAMDSSIPLKRRPQVESYTGEIPKIATERQLNETQLSDIRKFQALGGVENELRIREILFEDTPAVIRGQYEKHEYMFLQGLSTGTILVDSTTNVGTGIRVNFKYLADNQFNATVPWGSAGYTPLSDLAAVSQKSKDDGRPIRLFLLDNATMTLIAQSDEAKSLVYPAATQLNAAFPPSVEDLNTAVARQWGYRFEVIERSSVYEINGVQTTANPWEAGQVVGINNEDLGALVWTEIAEMAFPVAGVTYQRAGSGGYMLVKKYRVNRPSLAEFTASESKSLPVLADVNRIYKLDSTQGSTT